MFVKKGIENFTAMYRKAVYGFIFRLSQTDNRIVSGLFDSDLAFHSSIRKVWHSALYHDMIVTCTVRNIDELCVKTRVSNQPPGY